MGFYCIIIHYAENQAELVLKPICMAQGLFFFSSHYHIHLSLHSINHTVCLKHHLKPLCPSYHLHYKTSPSFYITPSPLSSIWRPFTLIHCSPLHLSGLFSPLHWFHQIIIDSVRWRGRCIWVSSVPSIRIRKDQSAVSYYHGFPWAAGSVLFCFLSFYCIWASDMTHYR